MTDTTNPAAIELLEKGLRKIAAQPKSNNPDLKTVLASGIKPVVEGMLDLARVSAQYVRIAKGGGEDTPFPLYPASSKMAVIFNPEPPECSCPLAGKATFAPRGQLDLKAVIFHEKGEIDLVLPPWTNTSDILDLNAYVVIGVELSGRVASRRYRPYIHNESYLKFALGKGSLEGAVASSTQTGSLDSVLGFPGAINWLAGVLPDLGEYFKAFAKIPNGRHQH